MHVIVSVVFFARSKHVLSVLKLSSLLRHENMRKINLCLGPRGSVSFALPLGAPVYQYLANHILNDFHFHSNLQCNGL